MSYMSPMPFFANLPLYHFHALPVRHFPYCRFTHLHFNHFPFRRHIHPYRSPPSQLAALPFSPFYLIIHFTAFPIYHLYTFLK